MNAVELRDVFRVHSTPEGDAAALQGLSLTVGEGEVVSVLGPSGAGKSTLLRILAGVEQPSAGTVRVFGEEIGKLPPRRLADYRATTLGYVDQHYTRALAPELTARELVGLQLGLRGEREQVRLARADELLERVGLGAKRDRRPPSSRAASSNASRCAPRLRTGRALPRRRADRRARRRDRRPRLRPGRRARPRARLHDADRQPRPGVGAGRRPHRSHPRRARLGGVDARGGAPTRSSSAAAAGCACRRSYCCAPASATARRRGSKREAIVVSPVGERLRAPPMPRPPPLPRPRERARSSPRPAGS